MKASVLNTAVGPIAAATSSKENLQLVQVSSSEPSIALDDSDTNDATLPYTAERSTAVYLTHNFIRFKQPSKFSEKWPKLEIQEHDGRVKIPDSATFPVPQALLHPP